MISLVGTCRLEPAVLLPMNAYVCRALFHRLTSLREETDPGGVIERVPAAVGIALARGDAGVMV